MRSFIFTDAEGRKIASQARIEGNLIIIEDGGHLLDFSKGVFEQVLPDGKRQIWLVNTYSPILSNDGFGCGWEISVEAPETCSLVNR